MGTLITLTAEEVGFLALFSELSAESQNLLRAAMVELAAGMGGAQ